MGKKKIWYGSKTRVSGSSFWKSKINVAFPKTPTILQGRPITNLFCWVHWSYFIPVGCTHHKFILQGAPTHFILQGSPITFYSAGCIHHILFSRVHLVLFWEKVQPRFIRAGVPSFIQGTWTDSCGKRYGMEAKQECQALRSGNQRSMSLFPKKHRQKPDCDEPKRLPVNNRLFPSTPEAKFRILTLIPLTMENTSEDRNPEGKRENFIFTWSQIPARRKDQNVCSIQLTLKNALQDRNSERRDKSLSLPNLNPPPEKRGRTFAWFGWVKMLSKTEISTPQKKSFRNVSHNSDQTKPAIAPGSPLEFTQPFEFATNGQLNWSRSQTTTRVDKRSVK